MEWGRWRSFLWGGVIGGLLGLFLAPRRTRQRLNHSLWHPGEGDSFSGPPCYREDDRFT